MAAKFICGCCIAVTGYALTNAVLAQQWTLMCLYIITGAVWSTFMDVLKQAK